jgi:hypothetical protein
MHYGVAFRPMRYASHKVSSVSVAKAIHRLASGVLRLLPPRIGEGKFKHGCNALLTLTWIENIEYGLLRVLRTSKSEEQKAERSLARTYIRAQKGLNPAKRLAKLLNYPF